MYYHGLIPRNFAELAKAVPIDCRYCKIDALKTIKNDVSVLVHVLVFVIKETRSATMNIFRN